MSYSLPNSIITKCYNDLVKLSKGQGPIRWKEFKSILGDLGFELKYLDSSHACFIPKWNKTKKISFGIPHGRKTKLSKEKLREYWRNLRDRYEWDLDEFKKIKDEAEKMKGAATTAEK